MDLVDFRRITAQLQSDEWTRDRGNFIYTADILGLLLRSSNTMARAAIWGEEKYYEQLFDEESERLKLAQVPLQVALIARHLSDDNRLCEALDMQVCRGIRCPMYVPAGTVNHEGRQYNMPFCSEFKMAFRK
jgi:hypothetical protein